MADKYWAVYYELEGFRGSVTVVAENEQLAREEVIGAVDSYIIDGLSERHLYNKNTVNFGDLVITLVEEEEM